jgi:hypothetical protein
MPSPQKAKGSAWERDVARFLSGLYKETFIRAPGSGAYVGGINKVRKEILHEGQIRAFKGDIVPGQSFPKFNAECKSYKQFPFHRLLQPYPIPMLEDWISQLMDVSDEGDFNILIMKFNQVGKFIAIESRHKSKSKNYIDYWSNTTGSNWRISDYEEFFTRNSELVKSLCA